MKSAFLISAAILSCLVVALAPEADASAVVNLEPGESFTTDISLEEGERLTYYWNSDPIDVQFELTDPDGVVLEESSGSWYSDSFEVSKTGDYTFRWENDGRETTRVDYSLNMFGPIEEGLSALAWAAIIIGIVVVAIIIIIVLVVVIGTSSRGAQPPTSQYPPPQYVAQAAATGVCPSCGTPVDPQASFCARCGFRYR